MTDPRVDALLPRQYIAHYFIYPPLAAPSAHLPRVPDRSHPFQHVLPPPLAPLSVAR